MKKVIKTALVCAMSLVVIFSCKKEDPKAPAKFAIDSSSKAFDELEIGKTSTHTFKVTNAGEESLELKSFNFSGTNSSEFESNGQTTIVKASESTEFTVTFKPASVGDKSATLAIGTNVGEQKVELTGKAKAKSVAQFAIDAKSKDFGSISVNKMAEHTFTITNKGTVDLEIKSVVLEGTDKDQFSTDGVVQKIAPNNTYAFKAIFKPTSAGSKTATLKLTTNVGEKTVALSGKATKPTTSVLVNIPDEKFKKALLAHGVTIKGDGISKIDTNGDGEICTDEAAAYKGTIHVGDFKNKKDEKIKDITGIEAFTAITKLDCNYNSIKSLDVSKNIALTELNCGETYITSLDVSKNKFLKTLACFNTGIKSLDLSKNSALVSLDLYGSACAFVNIANGNNKNVTRFDMQTTPKACIQHDENFDPVKARWQKDTDDTWSTNCK